MVNTLVPYLGNDLVPLTMEELGYEGDTTFGDWLGEMDERMTDRANNLWEFVYSLKGLEVSSEYDAEIRSLESTSSFYFSEIADEVIV